MFIDANQFKFIFRDDKLSSPIEVALEAIGNYD